MTLDLLNRPIAVGDTVLTKPSYSSELNCIATVKKVNGKSVIVEVQKKVNRWNRTTNKYEFVRIQIETIRRRPDYCVVINEQYDYNRQQWPEHYL